MRTFPLRQFKSRSSDLLRTIKKEKSAVVTDTEGRTAAYLVDPATYDAMQARLRLLEGIARGERAIKEGRVMSHAQARKKMARWLDKK